jgi:hypothetical protein
MTNITGHMLPGLGFILLGLYLFTKASNATKFHWLRKNSFWICLEWIFTIVSSCIGLLIEKADEVGSHSAADSHYQHYKMLSLMFLSGSMDLMHFFLIVNDNIFALIGPGCFIILGLTSLGHQQETNLGTYLHVVMGYQLIFIGLSKMGERVYLLNHHRAGENSEHYHLSMYKDVSVYETIFPMLISVFFICHGVLWSQGAFVLYIFPDPSGSTEDMSEEMTHSHTHSHNSAQSSLLYYNFVFTTVLIFFYSTLLHLIDKHKTHG